MGTDTGDNDLGSSAEAYLARFGLSSFRSGQSDVIEAVLAGRDCLCVMPTGGGKSLCYQLPGVMLDGLTLVVSPLIALMKDQVDQLQVLGLPVSFINSTLSMAEQFDRLDRMARGEFRLVYVVPERFRSQRFLEAVREVGLKLLAIDEAHCISEWGHDFRPDYARLGHFRRMLGRPTTIALTATATDQVRRDIVEQLDLRDPRTFITGFERPNLFYEVQCPRTDRQKAELLLKFLRRTPGSGIIYTSTRKRAEEVAGMISQKAGRRTAVYHAGMLPDQRRTAQEAFMTGRYEIVAATNAFGMGIDKSDVRFVVHYNLPGTLEAYYQEAGRAGRDGEPSRCLLFYAPSDRHIQQFFIESAYPGRENVEAVYDHLRSIDRDPIEMTQAEIKEQLSLPIGNDGVGNCEQLLEGAGVLERLVASQNRAALRLDSDLPTLVDLLPKQAKVRRKVLQAVERLVGPRRNELIHFHPRQLGADSDLDQSSIAHALRELNGLESFTYVPPFRGRAIRMIERDRPFDELEIDFAALQDRKAAEYEKLNRVIRFALGSGCRQREILRYFGEQDAPRCGHCDNCGEPQPQSAETGETHAAATDPKLIEAIRITLSGVARTQARFPCGKNLIALMLCGSGSAKMEKLGLNQLSTFGLLKHLKQAEVVRLIDGLVAMECLRNVEIEPMRPVIELTDFGSEVMRNEAELEGELPIPAPLVRRICGLPAPAEPRTEPTEMGEPDMGLLNALKQWRREEGSKLGQPLYQILSNATLTELARCRPDSPEALLEVKGIGPAKLERYGDQLLALLAGGESL
ncbi:MAG: ATP-dependent DNA helicase RecQ, partial [Candidatus Nealsonbacteria bacterium]|nr:ATP-dependent DNA helicase RecQ [Candidatus Nealsonbacteria bacterium]